MARSKKCTYEGLNFDEKNELKKIAISKGYSLIEDSTEYKNNTTKFSFIDSEGYKYYTSYSGLRRCKTLYRFGVGNIYNSENIYRWVELNARDKIEILEIRSNKVGNKEGVLAKCVICGGEMIKSWNALSSFHFCKSCSNKGLEYTTKDIKRKVNENVTILNEYVGIKEKAVCKCNICQHEWDTTFDSLVNGKTGCPECFRERMRGVNSSSWKGGVTPLYSNIRFFMLPWKIDSYKKYDHRCDITGVKLNSNIIHHHYNYSDILKETLKELGMSFKGEISNYTQEELELIKKKCLELHYKYGLGICLSKEIHKEFHSLYGVKNNTLEQYVEFKQNKLKELNLENEKR